MRIIADEAIPFVEHYFGEQGEVVLKPGRFLMRHDLMAADLLLVRSVTRINQALLEGTPVKFVGSTVTGTDHLDIDWLNQQGIRWSAAVGCNANATAEYVVTAVAALQKQGWLLGHQLRAGVVGVGRIGSRVAEKLKLLGFDVLLCDPLRAQYEKDFYHTPIEQLIDLDFMTLHTPLIQEGSCPTYHLIGKNFLQRQKKGCVLLNTGRGAVIDFRELKRYGRHLMWCLDVWEGEPFIDLEVLRAAIIASPHIAGHSIQSKYRGVQMVYQDAVTQGVIKDSGIGDPPLPSAEIDFSGLQADWRDVVLAVADPRQMTRQMKQAFLAGSSASNTFDELRGTLVRGHEFAFVKTRGPMLSPDDQALLDALKIR
jgi:erythronate-4-phosphate dehydrogenase